ncbi:extracellular solute-binding protein [Paracoccaceae bacterium GXU_MW_L88]
MAFAEPVTSHGHSIFGELKYPADFEMFDYVNPDAPKGGVYHTWDLGTFNKLTPDTEGGDYDRNISLTFDTLMVGTLDSLDQMYGLIAESITVAEDKSWVSFKLREEARFADDTPITADDILFTFDAMQNKAQLRYKVYYGEIESVEALGPHEVKFNFVEDAATRDLIPLIASTQIYSAAYYEDRDFSESTMEPPLGSGPYRVADVQAGRYIVYERRDDYWAKDLPVNVGRYNFDRIRVDYYADMAAAFEGFKAGEYTLRSEADADLWTTSYDFPAVQRGDVIKAEIPTETVASNGFLFMNIRREKLSDPRVREAIATMFNFEFVNETLLHGLETRAASYWENSDMEAEGPPPADERALLEPIAGELPEHIGNILEDDAAVPYAGSANPSQDRGRRRAALALLEEAGYSLENGRMVGPGGPLTLEIMTGNSRLERFISPFIESLNTIGISASLRFVDSAQWRERLDTRDYDMLSGFLPMSNTPGNELRDVYGSQSADVPGSVNANGTANSGIDKLIAQIERAETRDELNIRVRALDRVLRAMHLRVPYWTRPNVWIAYYDYYRQPEPKPPYGIGALSIWWADTERYDELKASGAIN